MAERLVGAPRALTPLRDAQVLGAEVRRARKQLRLTQQGLAEIAGVGTRFVSELERGKDTVRLGLALHLARLVGLDICVVFPTDDLLDGALW